MKIISLRRENSDIVVQNVKELMGLLPIVVVRSHKQCFDEKRGDNRKDKKRKITRKRYLQ